MATHHQPVPVPASRNNQQGVVNRMLTELRGKGGNVCQSAREGKLRCPLIIRPTSEDVITGHLFQVLGIINPRWWLADMLNLALAAPRFHRQVYRKLRIELWKNRPIPPRELLPIREGSTQVDVTISWENPPTTVFIEMKYLSELTRGTASHDPQSGYPSDQLIRNIRVGLWECGWLRPQSFFDLPRRDFYMIVIGLAKDNPLVEAYRDADRLLGQLTPTRRLAALPRRPFVGELSYRDIATVLHRHLTAMVRAEQRAARDLLDYLELKQAQARRFEPSRATQIRLLDSPDEQAEELGQITSQIRASVSRTGRTGIANRNSQQN